jgi:uncharacterized membrane protein
MISESLRIHTNVTLPLLSVLFVFANYRWLAAHGRARKFFTAVIAVAVSTALIAAIAGISRSDLVFGFDNAISHNMLWNLTEGRWTACDPMGQPLYSVHSFFLAPLFLPFYALGHPALLNLGHMLFAISAALPVYLLATQRFASRSAGLCMALFYLLLPSTSGLMLVECQFNIAGLPFLMWYLYWKDTGRSGLAAAGAALAAFAYEPFIAAIILDGLVDTIKAGPNRRRGAVVAAAGLGALALFALNRAGFPPVSMSRHYGDLGGSPLAIARTFLESPGFVIGHTFSREKIGFLLHLTLPTLLFPFVNPRVLIMALPELILVLLSDRGDDMHKINCFYTHVTTMCLVYGTIVGAAGMARRFRMDTRRLAFVLLCHALILQFAYHHTFLPRAAEYARKAVASPGLYVYVPETVVPRGSRVLVERHQDLGRFPWRRAMFPDSFLSPLLYSRRGVLEAEADFVARGAQDTKVAPPGSRVIAEDFVGMNIFRRLP